MSSFYNWIIDRTRDTTYCKHPYWNNTAKPLTTKTSIRTTIKETSISQFTRNLTQDGFTQTYTGENKLTKSTTEKKTKKKTYTVNFTEATVPYVTKRDDTVNNSVKLFSYFLYIVIYTVINHVLIQFIHK